MARESDFMGREFYGSTGDTEQDMFGREAMVESCLDQIFAAYDLGIDENIVDPVIFLVDCEDVVGASVARGWEGDDAVDAAIMANTESDSREGDIPTTILTRAASLVDSCTEVPKWFPYLEETLSQGSPSDAFYVIAITFGGAGAFSVPLTARPT